MPETLTETTVELNGVRLYTRRVGHGRPVVVLHGGPGAHHDYLLPQYDHLAEGGRTLLYYDQRGGGRSPVPRRPRSVRPLPDRSRKVSPHRVRAIRRRLFSRPEPREGNDPVSRHRAHSAGGVGESGDLRPPPADPADLPERDRSPRPAAARHLRPDAPRGGA